MAIGIAIKFIFCNTNGEFPIMAPDASTGIHAGSASEWSVELTKTISSWGVYEIASNKTELLQKISASNLNLIVIGENEYKTFGKNILDNLSNEKSLAVGAIVVGSEIKVKYLTEKTVIDVITMEDYKKEIIPAIMKGLKFLESKLEILEYKYKADQQKLELQVYHEIGVALQAEKDTNKLLNLILSKAIKLSGSDAGSFYLVTKNEMNWKATANFSVKTNFKEAILPINPKSIAGYVALNKVPLNICDAYNIDPVLGVGFNNTFDEKNNYRTTSMLTVPLCTHRGEIVGVLQLINKKKTWNTVLTASNTFENVLTFNSDDEKLLMTLASQAAVAVENAKLYQEITNLFDGFVKASVSAIESRDPTTSGHSERVADLTVAIAAAVNRDNENFPGVSYTDEDLQMIKYASLLHDFGKIGVKETILWKAKKLYPHELQVIEERFEWLKKSHEVNILREALAKGGASEFEIEKAIREKTKELQGMLDLIKTSNEPTVLEEGNFEFLQKIQGMCTHDHNRGTVCYLSSGEAEALSVRRGSLTNHERDEMNSHATHTYDFLKKIPWISKFKKIPEIAAGHHEKIDGTGYPKALSGDAIPYEAKMMAIADIYDALTALDRPYKKPIPPETALKIIQDEVTRGKLDSKLFDIFVREKIYLTIHAPKEEVAQNERKTG